jgi:hypothetical protein
MNSKLRDRPWATLRLIPIRVSLDGRVQRSSMLAPPRVVSQLPAIQARLWRLAGGGGSPVASTTNVKRRMALPGINTRSV